MLVADQQQKPAIRWSISTCSEVLKVTTNCALRKFSMFPLTLWTNLVIDFFGTYYLHIVCVLKQSFIFFLKIRLAFVNHIHTAELGFGTKRCWNGAVVPRWCWDGAVVPRWCRDGAVVLRVPNVPFPPWAMSAYVYIASRLYTLVWI